MLIRCLLIICLLIISAMPLCMAEVVSANTDTLSASNETIPTHSQDAMTMEDALERVTVSIKDWSDSDTYYIRYTFTNPTAVKIDKKVSLTTVAYKRCSLKEPFEYVYQCNTELTELTIPPHGKYKATISFPKKDEVLFNRHMYSNFFFDNGAYLKFDEEFCQNQTPLVKLATVISPENEIFLSIQNRSWFNTITDLTTMAIQLDNRCGYRFNFASENPISLNIPPRNTYLLPIGSLPTQFFDIPDSLRKLPRLPKFLRKFDKHNPYFISMDAELMLNHTHYRYVGMLSMTQPCTVLEEYTSRRLPRTVYDNGPDVIHSWSNTNNIYYLDDSYLHIYFELTNKSNDVLPPSPKKDGYSYVVNASYFDQDMYRHNNFVEVLLPADFTLTANETRYFTFKIPLPDDFYTLDPSDSVYLQPNDIPREPKLPFIQLFRKENPSLPISQDTYQVLDIVP